MIGSTIPYYPAIESLIRTCGGTHISPDGILGSQGQENLRQQLISRVLFITGAALQHDFSSYRRFYRRSGFMTGSSILHSSTCYEEFIGNLNRSGGQEFIRKYPALGRLISLVCALWLKNVETVTQRYQQDQQILETRFPEFRSHKQVAALEPQKSDYHHRGQTVMIMVDSNQQRLVYKPRSMGMAVAYYALLEWINRESGSHPFKILKVIDCTEYGWVEYAANRPCINRQEVERFYYQAGRLLCLVMLLRGRDIHYGNLIACGAEPVIVDLEGLISPPLPAESAKPEYSAVQDTDIGHSHMLPYAQAGSNSTHYDTSGLAGYGGQLTASRRQVWDLVNTDLMSLRYQLAETPPRSNQPSWDGTRVLPRRFVKFIARGVKDMYHFFRKRLSDIVAAGGPISAFEQQTSRSVLRATKAYMAVLHRAVQPDALSALPGFERALSVLGKRYPAGYPNEVLQVEERQMAALDIPYFYTQTTSRNLCSNQECLLEDFFARSGMDCMLEGLDNLSAKHLQHQLQFVHYSLRNA